MKSVVRIGMAGAAILLGLGVPGVPAAPGVRATVQADRPGHGIPKTLYGIFFEDINYAADGGLYAELIANRGFDWATQNLEAWTKEYRGGGMARLTRQAGYPVHPNTAQYLRLEVLHPGKDGAGVGVANHGFGGIAVKQGATYDLSFYARPHRSYAGGLTVALENKAGAVLDRYRIEPKDWRNRQPAQADASPLDPSTLADWVQYTAELVPAETAKDARLVVLCDAAGTVDLELVSLFPRDTYGKRRNGLRADLVQLLKDMHPGAVRFPGGCIVEGADFANLYDWKRTVGPIERRPVNHNLWGYWQSHGLGFFEYFQLCEDIGAEPLPILAAGMSCQFRQAELLPLEGMDFAIRSALDLIEFANGAPTTPWGTVRADMGHPAPFHLKMVGLGNENWDRDFLARYAVLYRAVKAKHPEIEIVSSAGAGPAGELYDLAWQTLPKTGAEWIDEHYYVPSDWLFGQNRRYDDFDRKGPKVYVGEYACHLPGRENSLFAALAEAHMMTGFERNSDVVGMTSYAPLFNKVGSTQWAPDLIWFDNTRSFGTPSYHVQALFARHRPDRLLPATVEAGTTSLPPTGRIGLHTWNTAAEFKDLRVTRGEATLYAWDPARKLEGWSKAREGKWEVADGVLRQTDPAKNGTLITVGERGWRDYTVRLKARSLRGEEGFIIRVRDQGSRFVHVNFGGWGNSEHGIEQNGSNPVVKKAGRIEPGRWYDVEIALDGEFVTAKLDGATVFERVQLPAVAGPAPVLVAGFDQAAGEIVVKCVNPVAAPCPLQLTLAGAKVAAQQARRITLTGDENAINDLDHPDRVAPVEDTLAVAGPAIETTLAPSSLTVLRIKATR